MFAVYEAAKKAVAHLRAGNGPYLLECRTYRMKGHFVGDPELYRSKEEVRQHMEHDDPIANFAGTVLKNKWMTKAQMDSIDAEVAEEVATAIRDAREDPYPTPDQLFEDYYIAGGA